MDIIVKKSSRRKKTIQARMVNGSMEVLAPASISDKVLQDHISKLRSRLEGRELRRDTAGMDTLKRDDAYLDARARKLNQRYFGGKLAWESIRYSTRQERRQGSCTYSDRTIRISYRLSSLPQWVEDYVIVHELAHLIEPNHGKHFKELVNEYPLSERARGFLMAIELIGTSG